MNLSKKAVVKFAVVLLLAVAAPRALAWSAAGHQYIATRVFAQLNAEEQRYYAALAQHLSPQKSRDPAAQFARLSRLPDRVRGQTLAQVFALHQQPVPAGLQAWAKRDTAAWHYQELDLAANRPPHCDFQGSGELLSALRDLDGVLRQVDKLNPRQHALVLAFTLHLMEDLHQPLHAFSRYDAACRADLGGNRECLVPEQGKKCERNLHQLWDEGFGVFDRGKKAAANNKHPPSPPVAVFQPESWLRENAAYFPLVYAVRNQAYDKRSREVIALRSRQAIERISIYLQQLPRS